MPVEHLTALDDPRIAIYQHVAEPELVRSRGLFIAEGRLVVRRLIEEGRYSIQSVLVSEPALRSLEDALASIADRVPIYVCHARDFVEMTGHRIHRGCLAMVERPPPRSLGDLFPVSSPSVAESARGSGGIGAAGGTTILVLEGLANPDNVGGAFRNAAAFGVAAVVLSRTCCDPLYRKAIRTSMAATLRVPFARAEAWPEDLAELRAHGFTIVALTPRKPATTLDQFVQAPRPGRIALLVGSEGEGLTAAAEAAADVRVRIPIAPEIDSLNVAVAVGIALHAFRVKTRDRRR
jgi:tRNA G18 (ribose-2'-O)-methylase SpoU